MGHSTIVLVASIVLALLILLFTLTHWRRVRSMRVLLQGLGLVLFVVGLYIIGFMDLVDQWAHTTWHWIQGMHLDTTHMIGLGVGGLGVLLFLIALMISPVSRAEAKQRRLARRESAQVAARPSAASTPASRTAPAAQRTVGRTAATKPASDSEDAEIEAILRNHGID